MAFYIYENWQAGPHKAVLHDGAYGFCKEGSGLSGEGSDPNHGKWHGPFLSLVEAREFQHALAVVERSEHSCIQG